MKDNELDQNIRRVRRAFRDSAFCGREVRGELGVAEYAAMPRVVEGRQVRHIHPLGRVQRARLRKRMVFPEHVFEGLQAEFRACAPVRQTERIRLQGFYSHVQGGAF